MSVLNAPEFKYPFTSSANYSFDANKIEFTGTTARIKLKEEAQLFNQPFTSDSGFVYDSGKAEFTGGLVRQLDQKPAGSTFYANYNSNLNGTWGLGTLTATTSGTPTITGGKADLTSESVKYVQYGASNINIGSVGAIRFKFTPNYSGIPAFNRYLFSASQANSNINNLIRILHPAGSGSIQIRMHDNTGALIFNTSLGVWSQTMSQEYEFELNIDLTTGATRLFIDGVQFGSTITTTSALHSTPTYFRIGQDYIGAGTSAVNGLFDDLILFSTVQHTSNYTPNASIPQNRYVESKVELPQFTHGGLGDIVSYNSLVTTETTSPRYTIKSGAGSEKYWNGSAWAVSNGTYSQSNDKATFTANLPTLTDGNGETQVQILLYFGDNANTQSSVDDLTFNYVGQTTYHIDNPSVIPNSSAQANQLCTFESIEIVSGSDEIKYTLLVDGVETYWNGSAWVASSGYAQSNTATEINTNAPTLTVVSTVKPIAYLHSNDGSTTPEIDQMKISFNYNAPDISDLVRIVSITGYLYNIDGTPDVGASVSAKVISDKSNYTGVNTQINNMSNSTVTDSDGAWVLNLIPSQYIENNKYKFTFNPTDSEAFAEAKTVPDTTAIDSIIEYDDF